MSFRINTNIAAQGALRNVNNSGDMLNKSINRLSTGLRINSAADDPAGLIASESFRSQISSIDQAVSNNQNAINYTKTAEGALSEVNSLLNDARTLAVASANSGVLTAEQTKANQDQLSSIVSSITRISQQTQFGSKKLLDGSAGINANVTDATKLSSLSINGTVGGAAVASNA
ncbi:flagellin, partial [bacterium]